MYLTIHTLTICENDWILQAQFLQTTTIRNDSGDFRNLIAKRVILRAYPIRFGKKRTGIQKPVLTNLKTILKRRNSNVRHHFRTIKMYVYIIKFILM